MKPLNRKTVVSIIACILMVGTLVSSTFYTGAVNEVKTYELTLEDAQTMAISATNSIIEVNQQISHLIKVDQYDFSSYKGLDDNQERQIEELYAKAIDHNVSNVQLGILFGYYTMYSNTTYFTKKDVKSLFSPDKYPNYTLWTNLFKLELNKKSIVSGIKFDIKCKYDQILKTKDQIEISKEKLRLLEKDILTGKKQYSSGDITKTTLDKLENNLKIQKLDLAKTERNLENLLIDFKKEIGIQLKDKVILKDYKAVNTNAPNDFTIYINYAYENSSKLLLSNINYWESLNSYTAANEAYINHMEVPKLKQERDKCYNNLNSAILGIKAQKTSLQEEIFSLYVDTRQKYDVMSAKKESIATFDKKIKAAQVKYKAKAISKDQLDRLLLDLKTLKVDYNNSVNEYNTSLLRLEYYCTTRLNK